MQTSKAVGKELMLKLRESFSLKSFCSASYQSSLICNSKTICVDYDLAAFSNTFSGANFTVRHLINASKNNRETLNSNAKNLDEPELKNRLDESSRVVKKPPTAKKMKKLLNTKHSLKSWTKDGDLRLKIPTKHSDQADQDQSQSSKTSSDFKSFQCEVCMKYFASKRGVKKHSILHSAEKHPCESCGKVFQTRENLRRHYKAIHEVKVKSIKCSQCYKAFSRKKDLQIHLKKHPDHVIQRSSTLPSTFIDLKPAEHD